MIVDDWETGKIREITEPVPITDPVLLRSLSKALRVAQAARSEDKLYV